MDSGSVIAGIKIFPSVVQFNDAIADETYKQTLTLQNVSGLSKSLRFSGPETEVFKLTTNFHKKCIAPGLLIKTTIEYCPAADDHYKDRILLIADDDVIEIPLLGICPVPLLHIEGTVDFGTAPADGRILKKCVKIINEGSRNGHFEISYAGSKSITIQPSSGNVEPYSELDIEVNFIADTATEFEEYASVMLESRPESKLSIKGKVMRRQLMLLNPYDTQPLRCVEFGPTYYGTQQQKQGILFNNSPDEIQFVAILLEDQLGQEVDSDLSLTTAQALTEKAHHDGRTNDILSLITTTPNQGILKPYEKLAIDFHFKPEYHYSAIGFKNKQQSPPRRDYAIYMQFTLVQNNLINSEQENKLLQDGQKGIEVAITGCALPVLLSIKPDMQYDFGSCTVSERTDALFTITNESKELAVKFKFSKIAHFYTNPGEGKLRPLQSQSIIISARPQQLGLYKNNINLNVIDNHGKIIHSIPIHVEVNCIALNRDQQGKTSNGHIQIDSSQSKVASKNRSRDDVQLANPNDLPGSVRPADPRSRVRSKYTRTDRYTYIDPDYALSKEETQKRDINNIKYRKYIDDLRDTRKSRQRDKMYQKIDSDIDLGIKPGAGLVPPTASLKELYDDVKTSNQKPKKNHMVLSNKIVDYCHNMTGNEEALKLGLGTIPVTQEEISDCSRTLMPAQIHLIKLAPGTLDYGEVCQQSTNSKYLRVANNLDNHILFSLEFDNCPEMLQSFPASQVIPPKSVAQFECIFEANQLGSYHRNITYYINRKHMKHLVLFANVVSVDLQLSTNKVVLKPKFGQPAHAGIRELVYVTNPRNYPAQFKWTLNNSGGGEPTYYISPATGYVEAFSTLACEVICHPTYRSSTEFGQAQCAFVERRLLFGSVPLHLTTTKIVLLQNTGQHHAHFEVVDSNPFQGMTITPISGLVAVGGYTEIKVDFTPTVVQKFDTSIHVKIRGWKTISLRVGGRVEEPRVDIDKQQFYFGGIHCGSFGEESFKLINKTNTPVKVAIDLSRFRDFKIRCDSQTNPEKLIREDGNQNLYTISMNGNEVISYILQFYPSEVASYDFYLPVTINEINPPSPPQSPLPPTPTTSKYSYPRIDTPTTLTQLATPKRHVLATALRPLLQLSHTHVEFLLSAEYTSEEQMDKPLQGCMVANCTDDELEWFLDIDTATNPQLEAFQFLDKDGNQFENGNLKPGESSLLGIVFNPARPGIYSASLPVCVRNKRQALRELMLHGELRAPVIEFEPREVWLSPAPIETEVVASCALIASGFNRDTEIKCFIPECELEDGSLAQVLCVEFPKGRLIQGHVQNKAECDNSSLPFIIKFQTSKPVSTIIPIQFKDSFGNSYTLNVAVTGENCLLTAYPFIASKNKDHHIIRNQQDSPLPFVEPILVKCEALSDHEQSIDNTSSIFDNITPFAEGDEGIESEITLSNLNIIDNQGDDEDEDEIDRRDRHAATDTSHSYLAKAVKAVERWYSFHGWPGGISPTIVPKSCYISIARSSSVTRAGRLESSSNGKRESKTIFDLIHHLCGRHVPGIPINSPLPSNLMDKAAHLHWQYSTLLTFLRTQGGMVGSIRAEYLLEPQCYESWIKQTGQYSYNLEQFKRISIRSWTHILLQLHKVFILNRVTQRRYKKIALIDGTKRLDAINPDPLASNIYNMSERILLDWLNYHFEKQRHEIWPDQTPAARWVVNFSDDLMDGLVLACVLGAYAPFLNVTYIKMLYTNPNNTQQCLHNAIHVINAIQSLGLEYDVQASDIMNPNPVSLLMLTTFLFDRLPHYQSKSTIEFQGALHSTILRQIRLQNPSTKPLHYSINIVGQDAQDFSVHSNHIQIAPHKKVDLEVAFKSRFLRAAQASLVLVGRRLGSSQASTLVFKMNAVIDIIKPINTLSTESPCFEVKPLTLTISNPFDKGALFRLMLIESCDQAGQSHHSRLMTDRVDTSPAELKSSKHEQLQAFWSNSKQIYLNPNESTTIEIEFLPFHLGLHTCSVLLANNVVGEFLYLIRTMATLPLPSVVPFVSIPGSVRISSAAAAGRGQGLFGGDPTIIYWRCNADQKLNEVIKLPIVNTVREQALAIAAKQQMSQDEIERRKLTKTLRSCTVLAGVAAMKLKNAPAGYEELPESEYQVRVSSKYFSTPTTIPILAQSSPHDKNKLSVPIKFEPHGAGHYPCQVILLSKYDIRVLKVECTVTATVAAADLEFHSPAYQSIKQEIPIANYTIEDWYLEAKLSGEGFVGPSHLVAKSFMTTYFPVYFRPTHEYTTTGRLVLSNQKDGNTHIFNLKGFGEKPLALDEIVLKCQARKSLTHVIRIPNVSRKWVTFKKEDYVKQLSMQVVTDIACVTGPGKVSVGPGKDADYEFIVTPLRRGQHKGIISFIAEESEIFPMGKAYAIDQQESNENSDENSDMGSENHGLSSYNDETKLAYLPNKADDLALNTLMDMPIGSHKVWYAVEINADPPPPEKVFDVSCAVQSSCAIEIGIANPTDSDINFQVQILHSQCLSAADNLRLQSNESTKFRVIYSPTIIGTFSASILFQNEIIGEFWYELKLNALPPEPTQLQDMKCELGKSCKQMIQLQNPTDEILHLTPQCSNTSSFRLDIPLNEEFTLDAQSSIEVPLEFVPSMLGLCNQMAVINFKSTEIGDWRFSVKGYGLVPSKVDPVYVSSLLGASASLILPFHNPFNEPLRVTVELIDKDNSNNPAVQQPVFRLLLKHTHNITLQAKGTLEIPFTFAPENMTFFETTCCINVKRQEDVPFVDDAGNPFDHLQWHIPIFGIPELVTVDSNGAVVHCQSRSRIEERLEITLNNQAETATEEKNHTLLTRAITPSPQDSFLMDDEIMLNEDFEYRLVYADDANKTLIEQAVGLSLIRKIINSSTNSIRLVFHLIFAPFKPFNATVQLVVTAKKRGVWKFPLKFRASSPQVDDTISIESVGLNKESVITFHLHSQEKFPVPFEAYFEHRSDAAFTVFPKYGELLPLGTQGTAFTITYKPSTYGRTHRAKLIVQTKNMQWTYAVKGLPKDYIPPSGHSTVHATSHSLIHRRRNFVQENLKLTTAGVSSPIKGGPLLQSKLNLMKSL
ncbi:Cilia- and flagella-associated protein 47 [Trichoplax sp. H2]|nr:Cilia- and flagella-associated protein 47 [Trichoplax sp. H2]|eukprot:RDD38935.1 Cilia- and flagella-associated protein 47 [Trichoplax sp. H2]